MLFVAIKLFNAVHYCSVISSVTEPINNVTMLNTLLLLGLWIGFFGCIFLQSLFFIILICKLDWKKSDSRGETFYFIHIYIVYLDRWWLQSLSYFQALIRAGVQVSETKDKSYAIENKGYTEGSFCLLYDGIVVVKKKYFIVDFVCWLIMLFFVHPWTELPQQYTEEGQTDENTDLEGLSKREGGITNAVTLVTVGTVLTTKQLVVRRGLAFFFMLLILAGGIVLNGVLTYYTLRV